MKPGRDDQPARIEFLVRGAARLARRSDLGHLPVAQQDVHGRIDLRGRIDKPSALDQQAVIFSLDSNALPLNLLATESPDHGRIQ